MMNRKTKEISGNNSGLIFADGSAAELYMREAARKAFFAQIIIKPYSPSIVTIKKNDEAKFSLSLPSPKKYAF